MREKNVPKRFYKTWRTICIRWFGNGKENEPDFPPFPDADQSWHLDQQAEVLPILVIDGTVTNTTMTRWRDAWDLFDNFYTHD